MIAGCTDGATMIGNPQKKYVAALAKTASNEPGAVALLAAPGFIEDQQVVAGIAHRLRHRGFKTIIAEPRHLRWDKGRASLRTESYNGPVTTIVRFYQGEWLANLPRQSGWHFLFTNGTTPIANPGCAILTESKRLPLVWDQLGVACTRSGNVSFLAS